MCERVNRLADMQSPSLLPTPEPPPPAPKSRKTLWIVLGIMLAVIVLGAGAVTFAMKGITTARANAGAVADRILGHVVNGTYSAMWDEATPEFQRSISKEKLNGLLNTVSQQAGKPVSWKNTGFNTRVFYGPNGKTNTTVYTYDVTHEKGRTRTTLTVDGTGRLLGIHFSFGN